MSTTIESRDRLIDILSLSYFGDLLREQLGDDAENYTWPDDFEKAVADIGFSGLVMRGDSSPYEMLVFGAGLETRTRAVGVGYGGSAKIRKIRFFGDVRRIPPYGLIDEDLLTDIVLPDGMIEIGMNGLANTGFEEIEFPDSVVSIAGGAFNQAKIKTINTNKVSSFTGYSVFSNCKNLLTAELPNVVGALNYQAFANCDALITVHIPKCTAFNSATTGQQFIGCTALKECIIGSVGSAVTTIGTQTFLNLTQSDLEITCYTNETSMSNILTSIRNQATNATIIIKAAAGMEYNGTTYQAGDTVLTSTP